MQAPESARPNYANPEQAKTVSASPQSLSVERALQGSLGVRLANKVELRSTGLIVNPLPENEQDNPTALKKALERFNVTVTDPDTRQPVRLTTYLVSHSPDLIRESLEADGMGRRLQNMTPPERTAQLGYINNSMREMGLRVEYQRGQVVIHELPLSGNQVEQQKTHTEQQVNRLVTALSLLSPDMPAPIDFLTATGAAGNRVQGAVDQARMAEAVRYYNRLTQMADKVAHTKGGMIQVLGLKGDQFLQGLRQAVAEVYVDNQLAVVEEMQQDLEKQLQLADVLSYRLSDRITGPATTIVSEVTTDYDDEDNQSLLEGRMNVVQKNRREANPGNREVAPQVLLDFKMAQYFDVYLPPSFLVEEQRIDAQIAQSRPDQDPQALRQQKRLHRQMMRLILLEENNINVDQYVGGNKKLAEYVARLRTDSAYQRYQAEVRQRKVQLAKENLTVTGVQQVLVRDFARELLGLPVVQPTEKGMQKMYTNKGELSAARVNYQTIDDLVNLLDSADPTKDLKTCLNTLGLSGEQRTMLESYFNSQRQEVIAGMSFNEYVQIVNNSDLPPSQKKYLIDERNKHYKQTPEGFWRRMGIDAQDASTNSLTRYQEHAMKGLGYLLKAQAEKPVTTETQRNKNGWVVTIDQESGDLKMKKVEGDRRKQQPQIEIVKTEDGFKYQEKDRSVPQQENESAPQEQVNPPTQPSPEGPREALAALSDEVPTPTEEPQLIMPVGRDQISERMKEQQRENPTLITTPGRNQTSENLRVQQEAQQTAYDFALLRYDRITAGQPKPGNVDVLVEVVRDYTLPENAQRLGYDFSQGMTDEVATRLADQVAMSAMNSQGEVAGNNLVTQDSQQVRTELAHMLQDAYVRLQAEQKLTQTNNPPESPAPTQPSPEQILEARNIAKQVAAERIKPLLESHQLDETMDTLPSLINYYIEHAQDYNLTGLENGVSEEGAAQIAMQIAFIVRNMGSEQTNELMGKYSPLVEEELAHIIKESYDNYEATKQATPPAAESTEPPSPTPETTNPDEPTTAPTTDTTEQPEPAVVVPEELVTEAQETTPIFAPLPDIRPPSRTEQMRETLHRLATRANQLGDRAQKTAVRTVQSATPTARRTFAHARTSATNLQAQATHLQARAKAGLETAQSTLRKRTETTPPPAPEFPRTPDNFGFSSAAKVTAMFLDGSYKGDNKEEFHQQLDGMITSDLTTYLLGSGNQPERVQFYFDTLTSLLRQRADMGVVHQTAQLLNRMSSFYLEGLRTRFDQYPQLRQTLIQLRNDMNGRMPRIPGRTSPFVNTYPHLEQILTNAG